MYSLDELQVRLQRAFHETEFPGEPPALYEPIRYTLELGGKRIRPLLVLAGCDLFGGDVNKALPPAIGIEIFHNFTLLHDDIMDHAPLRRGKETVYKKWNTNVAILSGDTMFALAYDYISRVDMNCLPAVLPVFTKTAIQVCEGQQYDMDFERQEKVSISDYLHMIRLKTAVLLACSLKIGAIIAGAEIKEADKLYGFGENLGLAFQLQDDLLDAFGDEKKFGKEIGGDIVANKKTFLYLKALEIANAAQANELIQNFSCEVPDTAGKIEKVKAIYQVLGIPELTDQVIGQYFSKALSFLERISAEDSRKEVLRLLAYHLLNRDH